MPCSDEPYTPIPSGPNQHEDSRLHGHGIYKCKGHRQAHELEQLQVCVAVRPSSESLPKSCRLFASEYAMVAVRGGFRARLRRGNVHFRNIHLRVPRRQRLFLVICMCESEELLRFLPLACVPIQHSNIAARSCNLRMRRAPLRPLYCKGAKVLCQSQGRLCTLLQHCAKRAQSVSSFDGICTERGFSALQGVQGHRSRPIQVAHLTEGLRIDPIRLVDWRTRGYEQNHGPHETHL